MPRSCAARSGIVAGDRLDDRALARAVPARQRRSWQPFREVNAATDQISDRYDVGIVSNVDDKLLGISRRHLRTELDLVVTAQQVRSYKPDNTHFRECARRIGGKKGWVHIGCGYDADIAPLPEDERAGDLGQPPR